MESTLTNPPSAAISEAIRSKMNSSETKALTFETEIAGHVVADNLAEIGREHGPESPDPKDMHQRRHTDQVLKDLEKLWGITIRVISPKGIKPRLRRAVSRSKIAMSGHDAVVKDNKVIMENWVPRTPTADEQANEAIEIERQRLRGMGEGKNEGDSATSTIAKVHQYDLQVVNGGSSSVVGPDDDQIIHRTIAATEPGAFNGFTLAQNTQSGEPLEVIYGAMSDMLVPATAPPEALRTGMYEVRELKWQMNRKIKRALGVDRRTGQVTNPEGFKNLSTKDKQFIVKTLGGWIGNLKDKGKPESEWSDIGDQVGWHIGREVAVLGGDCIHEGATKTKNAAGEIVPVVPDLQKLVVTQDMATLDAVPAEMRISRTNDQGETIEEIAPDGLNYLTDKLRSELEKELRPGFTTTIELARARKREVLAMDMDDESALDTNLHRILELAYYYPQSAQLESQSTVAMPMLRLATA
ncbi:hypothetical protein A2631_01190 [Candidatus Daviesbacteria bacterium RIFCSPHIGHO2_01_FULL_44_29]|uniref:Uncharacterized protein n=1 Tax=Candidatus Daviesbacteria bacterium RIFCSPHIGHO2_02_FULL_43_12 TaxID=1797776 RepID=A0A1F5KJB1_9BACT|nr:MAG: hypothetical protein A2631_01190 [Candidatus Daviesbacteria bacterium RIFCSPHIGHO2_01_FULL_44_29]OGE40711.1 MAG: hypothetical protein A3D25_05555 [Candidatus Daviesbacteria bacterium RIFCSPHIGHO2_02_FULL_43_12]OGE69792.1 MAG: hypothetical protein A3B55_05255 [Candidatus Daviesbacteria bacterium RIFCSPLOWO2_01_FULL_43_15]